MLAALLNALVVLRHPLLALRFARATGRWPSVLFPRTYFDIVQWRKVVDHNPLFTVFSDKLATKDFVRAQCPDLAVPDTLWRGTRFDDLPRELLQGSVVVKANHGSGMNYFVRAGAYDERALAQLCRRWMRTHYGRSNAEWGYRGAQRAILVEALLTGEHGPPVEINIRAGNGRAWFGSLLIDAKRPTQAVVYLDVDGRVFDVVRSPAASDMTYTAPPAYAEAIRYAEHMSRDVDYARFDFYWTGTTLYAGEITVYPASGYVASDAVAERLHRHWDIRTSWFMTTPTTGWRRKYQQALARHCHRAHRTPHD